MSKYVTEIIQDIKQNPKSYIDIGFGIKKDNVRIFNYGNSIMLSVINIEINDKRIPTSYIDLWRLEKTIQWWYKNIDIKSLTKKY